MFEALVCLKGEASRGGHFYHQLKYHPEIGAIGVVAVDFTYIAHIMWRAAATAKAARHHDVYEANKAVYLLLACREIAAYHGEPAIESNRQCNPVENR